MTWAYLYPGGFHGLVASSVGLMSSRFTNSRSLPSPQTLSLETVWIFSIVSRCDSFEGKGRKMPRMEIEIVRQATRRTHGLAVPWAHRLRRADRREGFQQRPSQQGQTNPPLQRFCCPRPRHFQGGGVLRLKEVFFLRT